MLTDPSPQVIRSHIIVFNRHRPSRVHIAMKLNGPEPCAMIMSIVRFGFPTICDAFGGVVNHNREFALIGQVEIIPDHRKFLQGLDEF